MYIQDIRLNNFRSANNLSIKLHKDINVFAGINGVGKTTILDASAILLSEVVKIFDNNKSALQFSINDINNQAEYASIAIHLKDGQSLHKVALNINRNSNALAQSLNEMQNYWTQKLNNVNTSACSVNIPLFAYYPVERAVQASSIEVQHEHNFSVLDAYTNCLDGTTTFKAFFEWFRLREDLENENNRRSKTFNTDKQLDYVRKALSIFMPQLSDIHIQRNPLRMVAKKEDKEIYINQLSDGEKCLFALIGDLARRLAIANPMRENPLEGEGVVLIDEIDLHLHPSWQQMIIPRLRETFPNCQFLLSTHSPHVLTHLEAKKVFMLDMQDGDMIADNPRSMYGQTSESILLSHLGLQTTRPPHISELLQSIYIDIQNKDLSKAKKKVSKLEKAIGDDSELSKARALIQRMELIGK